MANKENLPPRNEGNSNVNDDRSTPPGNIPATLRVRPWQHAAYTSPPSGLLSPSSKASLARQRDHSACRKNDSTLKVRKTRENLKQASIYGDVPTPCMHASMHDLCNSVLLPSLSFTSATTVNSNCDCTSSSDHHTDDALNGTTLLSSSQQEAVHAHIPTSPPLHILDKVSRQKSVSRRMLSRVKEGITYRSRSSHGTRVPIAEHSLMRRLSGKRKTSTEEQRQLRSFEISRDSIDSESDTDSLETTRQRSFTDSSVATSELVTTGITLTPPPGFRYGARQPPRPLLSSTSSSQSPAGDATPRANIRDSVSEVRGDHASFQACMPFIDMHVSTGRDALDVGISKDVWVAVEAVVRSRAVETSACSDTRPLVLSKKPIDMVIFICRETLAQNAGVVQQCIVELCSRLEVVKDRLTLLAATSRQIDSTTMHCVCAQLHPLRAPNTSALLERLGLAPSTARNSPQDVAEDQPIQVALSDIVAQGLREDYSHGIVIARDPVQLARVVERSIRWPVHLFKIGLYPPDVDAAASRRAHIWSLDVRYEGDISAPTLDNMFRDMRHGYHLGSISSLRLCYKAMDRARVVEVVGEKAVKDLKLGQRCSLFIKVSLPKIDTVRDARVEGDQDSLFSELESIVGTLSTNFLHVEARYRHATLPIDNIVTVRHICTIRRPKAGSRWSLVTLAADGLSSEHVNTKLAGFLIAHYAPQKALEAITRWELASLPVVQQMCEAMKARTASSCAALANSTPSPAVIVTDTTQAVAETPHVAQAATRTTSAATLFPRQLFTQLPHSPSTSAMIATRIISAPKGTTALSTYGTHTASSREGTPSDANDTAHQLWQHLRRDSLSSKQMLDAMSHEKLQQLEASDEDIKALHGQALANKRSIGAETLKEWKWDDDRSHGVAPWL